MKTISSDEIGKQLIQYKPILLGKAFRFLKEKEGAENIVQETFLRAVQKWDSFDGRDLKSWLFTIMKNLFINEYRKWKLRPPHGGLFNIRHPDMIDPDYDDGVKYRSYLKINPVEQEMINKEKIKEIEEKIKLMDMNRDKTSLKKMKTSFSQTAEIIFKNIQKEGTPNYNNVAITLGTSVGTVKSRWHRIRNYLGR